MRKLNLFSLGPKAICLVRKSGIVKVPAWCDVWVRIKPSHYQLRNNDVRTNIWLSLVMLVTALFMLSACDVVTSATDSTATSPITTSCDIENEFYIIYETNWNPGSSDSKFLVLLDTKNHTIGSPTQGKEEYYATDFYIPCDDLNMLLDAIIQHDIKSLSGPGVLTGDGSIAAHPYIHYRITFFLDGETYSVTFDTIVAFWGPFYPNLGTFHSMLRNYYGNTDEYQSFPPIYRPI